MQIPRYTSIGIIDVTGQTAKPTQPSTHSGANAVSSVRRMNTPTAGSRCQAASAPSARVRSSSRAGGFYACDHALRRVVDTRQPLLGDLRVLLGQRQGDPVEHDGAEARRRAGIVRPTVERGPEAELGRGKEPIELEARLLTTCRGELLLGRVDERDRAAVVSVAFERETELFRRERAVLGSGAQGLLDEIRGLTRDIGAKPGGVGRPRGEVRRSDSRCPACGGVP